MSIYRYPVTVDWFGHIPDGLQAMDSLLGKTIIRHVGNGYELHTLIKEFTVERIGLEESKAFHMEAADFYSKHADEYLDELEEIYHLVKAEKVEDAVNLVIKKGEVMVREGFFELLYILNLLKGLKISFQGRTYDEVTGWLEEMLDGAKFTYQPVKKAEADWDADIEGIDDILEGLEEVMVR